MEKHIVTSLRCRSRILLVSGDTKTVLKFQQDHATRERQLTLGWVRVAIFRPIVAHDSEMVQVSVIIKHGYETAHDLSNGVIFNDIE